MIYFDPLAKFPKPVYQPSCGNCNGYGSVPNALIKSMKRCEACNGTGKEPADE